MAENHKSRVAHNKIASVQRRNTMYVFYISYLFYMNIFIVQRIDVDFRSMRYIAIDIIITR